MSCTQIDCTEPATVLVRSDGMNDDGIMVLVMWSGWDRVTGSLYCGKHAGQILAGLPSLAPQDRAPTATDGEVFTHG